MYSGDLLYKCMGDQDFRDDFSCSDCDAASRLDFMHAWHTKTEWSGVEWVELVASRPCLQMGLKLTIPPGILGRAPHFPATL